MRIFANYGRLPGQWQTPTVVGINSRLDDLQARFLLRKLPFVHEHRAERAFQVHTYQKQLAHLGVQFQEVLPDTESAHHLCTILHPERDKIQRVLQEMGIETRVHYPYAPHQIKAYGYTDDYAPVAAQIARQTLSLPL
jgi:dTDP-4-amino-4,6-dideoxygalactose transaminase